MAGIGRLGATLRIQVCGAPAIVSGDLAVREADLASRQGRRVWAALVLGRRGPVSRDALAWAVWGDDEPEAAAATLNALVSRLRKATAPIALRHPGFALRGETGRYQLLLPADAFIDWERARDAIHEADRLAFQGDPSAALAEARVAMEIAARGFLPGEDGPWASGRRQELADIRARAIERTIDGDLARGRPDLALIEARQAIALDPLRESGWGGAMLAAAAAGDAGLAARLFAECRQTLRRHAGIEPSPETAAVWRRIAGRPGPPGQPGPPGPPDLPGRESRVSPA
ncbi:MAG: BTAD domain-containing putative transcriptional regulator [Chloroflexota bacterium]